MYFRVARKAPPLACFTTRISDRLVNGGEHDWEVIRPYFAGKDRSGEGDHAMRPGTDR